ncbi:hypothetical protein [Kitasatospora sp. CB01950]|uniref:hypothetical protein n=1 Tax=Kitasatospora sp. CB01950 TaxID=1703930 RepID=UPI00093B9B0D|nr:hypothetical protein [Kitasatospora sp. CB01950]OKJ13763.1 hypothetical protein AMK19_10100 [Kitasatospora sp. CB01950]
MDDAVTPAAVVVVGGVDECGCEFGESVPVPQGEAAGFERLVLGVVKFVLPVADVGRPVRDRPVGDGLAQDAAEHGEGVLDGGSAAAVGGPREHGAVDQADGDQADGQVSEIWEDPQAQAGEVGGVKRYPAAVRRSSGRTCT